MSVALIIGNIFSFFSAFCIAVSALKKSKKKFMLWQIGDATFGIFANIALFSYSALVISIVCLIRNILSYQNKFTKQWTFWLFIVSIVVGLYANNRGIIGYCPIIASASFTIFVYTTKNEQQMRYVLIFNMLLWFIHNVYIQAYPSAVANIVLAVWTSFQAFKYRKQFALSL